VAGLQGVAASLTSHSCAGGQAGQCLSELAASCGCSAAANKAVQTWDKWLLMVLRVPQAYLMLLPRWWLAVWTSRSWWVVVG